MSNIDSKIKKKATSSTASAPAAAINQKVYNFCNKKRMILAIVICVAVALLAGMHSTSVPVWRKRQKLTTLQLNKQDF